MFKFAATIAAATLASLTVAAPAFAKDVTVRYGDLDLASPEGQHTLSRRIDRAARNACELDQEGRIPSTAALKCFKQARTSAHTEVAMLVDNARLGG